MHTWRTASAAAVRYSVMTSPTDNSDGNIAFFLLSPLSLESEGALPLRARLLLQRTF
jgi:hypothetical protein